MGCFKWKRRHGSCKRKYYCWKKDLANKIIEIQNCIDNKKPYEEVFFDDDHIVDPEVLYGNDKQFKNKYLIYLETFGVSADSEF